MSYEEFVGHETRNELAFRALDTNGDGFVSRSGSDSYRIS